MKSDKKIEYYYPYCDIKSKKTLHRNYGSIFLNEIKYDRNIAFQKHDNAYGIKSVGTKKFRALADKKLYVFLKSKNDPLARLIYLMCRVFGVFYYNYKK